MLVHTLDIECIHSLLWVGVAQSSLGSLQSPPGTCLSPHTRRSLVCPLLHMSGFEMD